MCPQFIFTTIDRIWTKVHLLFSLYTDPLSCSSLGATDISAARSPFRVALHPGSQPTALTLARVRCPAGRYKSRFSVCVFSQPFCSSFPPRHAHPRPKISLEGFLATCRRLRNHCRLIATDSSLLVIGVFFLLLNRECPHTQLHESIRSHPTESNAATLENTVKFREKKYPPATSVSPVARRPRYPQPNESLAPSRPREMLGA
jgi:hypothetical protein